MTNGNKRKLNKKVDLLIKIVLIIIIILLLIHNCVLIKKNGDNYEENIDIIDINCGGNKCTPSPTNKPIEIDKLSFSSKNVSVKVGEKLTLIAIVDPSSLSDSILTWSSSDSSIVTVDKNGVITGMKEGTAAITVTSSNGKSATCVVKVTKNAVDVKNIKLSTNKLTMKVGSVNQLIATIEPSNATNRELVWSSSDSSIATVNNKGVIKGIREGVVTITVKTKNGKVIAKSTITIENVPTPTSTPMVIESLSFNEENISVKKGDSLNLVVTVKPSELSSSKLTWKSSDSSIVSVDENGVITGLKEGTVTITVTSSNGKSATCKVTVTTDSIDVEKIVLNPTEMNLKVGSTSQITSKVLPENATNRELVWTSSDNSVLSVDDKGIVKGLKAGTAIVTVKTKDGKVVATVNVTIENIPSPTPTQKPTSTPMVIESLSFNEENVSVKKGNSLNLVVEVKPSELSSSKLTWKSSDSSIVSVDENGVITGLKEGTVTITVTSSNGKSATCKVTVTTDSIDVEKIVLNPTEMNLKVGSTSQITSKVLPENATNRELVWTSNNPNVVTVDNNGIVKAINPGNTTITVKTKDGKVVATVNVTIEDDDPNFKVFDEDKPPIEWDGATDLKIFSRSIHELDGIIAPESSNTYKFVVRNSTDYKIRYNIKFIESNDYDINMKYKLKKNDTYIIDTYSKANTLDITGYVLNKGETDTYYLDWKWISSDNDTSIGQNPTANYGLKIEVEAESINE